MDQTQDIARRQENITGENGEKSVSESPKVAALGQALKIMNFPADKNSILRYVEQTLLI